MAAEVTGPDTSGSKEMAPYSVFAGIYDDVMHDIDYEDWAEFLLTELVSRGFAGGPVLDLACGTGNSAVPLIRRGFSVTGVDSSEAMLAVARSKHPEVTWLEGGFTDFSAGGPYALVQSVFDAVNNLLEPEHFVLMAKNVNAHLEPGGWFAFDANTSHGLKYLWEAGGISGWAGEAFYAWDYAFDEERGLARVEAGFVINGERYHEVHTERKYDPDELRNLLLRAGFTEIDVIEYPDGEPAAADSPRVWVLARKPLG